MTSLRARRWIQANDMQESVDQIMASFDPTDAAARNVLVAKVACPTCGGTGEGPTGHLTLTGGFATGECRTCSGAGSYVPLTIDGDAYRATCMEAYCLTVIGVAAIDTATAYRLLELV